MIFLIAIINESSSEKAIHCWSLMLSNIILKYFGRFYINFQNTKITICLNANPSSHSFHYLDRNFPQFQKVNMHANAVSKSLAESIWLCSIQMSSNEIISFPTNAKSKGFKTSCLMALLTKFVSKWLKAFSTSRKSIFFVIMSVVRRYVETV